MDKKGIGKPIGCTIALSSLGMVGHIILMLAAGDAESELLHFLSYILLIPSLIAMVTVMIANWIKTQNYFITFEEITKNYLDSYFDKVNREKYSARGLEWATAQLGHFWIELRVKLPNTAAPEGDISKENAFIHNDAYKAKAKNEDFERAVSIENPLESQYENEGDEMIKKDTNKRSEISGLSGDCKDLG